MGFFAQRAARTARRAALRRQLEGALETLEAAVPRYASLLASLNDPHWATTLAMHPGVLDAALDLEPKLQEALGAAKRRAARGDVGERDLVLADLLDELREKLDQFCQSNLGLESVAQLRSLCQHVVTLAETPWWSASVSGVELSLPIAPDEFLAVLAKEAQPKEVFLGMDPPDEFQDFVEEDDGEHFHVSTPRRYDRSGALCAWKGTVYAMPFGCVVRSRIGFCWRLAYGRALIHWVLPLPALVIWAGDSTTESMVGSAIIGGLGVALAYRLRTLAMKDVARLERFARRVAAALGADEFAKRTAAAAPKAAAAVAAL